MREVTVDVIPAHAAVREYCLALAERLQLEAERLGKIMDLQRQSRGRKSLKSREMAKRFSALVEASNQAISVASSVLYTGVCPRLDGESLLPNQSRSFLDGLGSYHKLYHGKVGAMYSRAQRRRR